jgi:HSP20 family protein
MSQRQRGQERAEETQTEKLEERRTVAPLVDVYETENEIVAFADMPGVITDHVRVELEKGTLTLEGKRLDESGEADKAITYLRSFAVPRSIDADKVSAELQHGVLRVVLPKQDINRPRQIAVRAS